MRADAVSTPVRLWAASELRRRWPALVVLGLLGGLAAGLAIAAVDGAQRTDTAYNRMRTQFLAADAVFFPSQVGIGDADVSKLDQLPEVAAWGGFASVPGRFDQGPGGPLITVGPDWFTTIERATVLEGRVPDPARDDEAVINVQAKALGGYVGGVLTWRTLSAADQATFGDDPPADFDWTKATGPVTELRIVGIVRLPMEYVISFATGPNVYPSPAWAAAHLGHGLGAAQFTNAVVRLRNGVADIPQFQADVARLYGRNDIPVKDLSDDVKRIQRSLDVERTALLLFAAAVVLATVVLVGQAFVRSVRAGSEAVPVLRAMGLSRGGLVAGLVAPHVLAMAVAAGTAGSTAVLLSSRFPIGLGHKLDPDAGIHVNWPTWAIGVASTVAATAVACAIVAMLTVRRFAGRRRTHRRQLVGAVTRTGAPIPAAVGVSLALEAAPSRAGATARPALIAAVVGIFGVVGAVTLVGGIDDALHRPERVGTVWDLEAGVADAHMDVPTESGILGADQDIAAFGLTSRQPSVIDGKEAPLYSLESLAGSLRFVTLRGRPPDGADEISLGPRTANLIHAHVGDTVTVGPHEQKMKVVGLTLLVQTPHSSFDEGALVTPSALGAVTEAMPVEFDRAMLIRLRPGVSTAALVEALGTHGISAEAPAVPPDVANLGNVRSLPLFLAAFLVLLAVGAVAHALLTGARSRSRDLAVLRALGLTPRQAAACVTWQAAVIGVVALVIGIPVGVVVGRQVWRVLAHSLSFVYVGPLGGLVLVVLAPVALAVLGVLALWPARGAARLRTAEVLRTE